MRMIAHGLLNKFSSNLEPEEAQEVLAEKREFGIAIEGTYGGGSERCGLGVGDL